MRTQHQCVNWKKIFKILAPLQWSTESCKYWIHRKPNLIVDENKCYLPLPFRSIFPFLLYLYMTIFCILECFKTFMYIENNTILKWPKKFWIQDSTFAILFLEIQMLWKKLWRQGCQIDDVIIRPRRSIQMGDLFNFVRYPLMFNFIFLLFCS